MKNIKTANIMLMIVAVLVLAGFVVMLTRKQTITIGGVTSELKSSWKKPAADKTEKPADKA